MRGREPNKPPPQTSRSQYISSEYHLLNIKVFKYISGYETPTMNQARVHHTYFKTTSLYFMEFHLGLISTKTKVVKIISYHSSYLLRQVCYRTFFQELNCLLLQVANTRLRPTNKCTSQQSLNQLSILYKCKLSTPVSAINPFVTSLKTHKHALSPNFQLVKY